MSEQQQIPQHFEIQKVYLKDVSLETPNSPMIFTEQWQPQTEVRLESGATPLTEDLFEVGRRDLLEHVRRDRAKPSGKQALQGQRLAFELPFELAFELAFKLAHL